MTRKRSLDIDDKVIVRGSSGITFPQHGAGVSTYDEHSGEATLARFTMGGDKDEFGPLLGSGLPTIGSASVPSVARLS